MATIVLKMQYLSVGGSDISAYLQGLTLTGEYDEVEMTARGDAAHNGLPGLGNWSIEAQCKQDFGAGLLDAIIWPIVGASAASAIIAKPDGSTTSTSNPKWTANGRIFSYSPIQGAVGDGAKTAFTIKPGDGSMIVRATAD